MEKEIRRWFAINVHDHVKISNHWSQKHNCTQFHLSLQVIPHFYWSSIRAMHHPRNNKVNIAWKCQATLRRINHKLGELYASSLTLMFWARSQLPYLVWNHDHDKHFFWMMQKWKQVKRCFSSHSITTLSIITSIRCYNPFSIVTYFRNETINVTIKSWLLIQSHTMPNTHLANFSTTSWGTLFFLKLFVS